jgi:hypothetical protein
MWSIIYKVPPCFNKTNLWTKQISTVDFLHTSFVTNWNLVHFTSLFFSDKGEIFLLMTISFEDFVSGNKKKCKLNWRCFPCLCSYWSTLARDVPFAGLMVSFLAMVLWFWICPAPVTATISIWLDFHSRGLILFWCSNLFLFQVTFYEALKDLTEYGRKKYFKERGFHISSTFEGLVLGGLAGGNIYFFFYLIHFSILSA